MRASVPTALSKLLTIQGVVRCTHGVGCLGTLSLLTSFIHLPSFIVQEVGPMNELLGEDVDVNFVAYGNADTQEVDGEYVFSCQVRDTAATAHEGQT